MEFNKPKWHETNKRFQTREWVGGIQDRNAYLQMLTERDSYINQGLLFNAQVYESRARDFFLSHSRPPTLLRRIINW